MTPSDGSRARFRRESPFVGRLINPIRIREVLLFAAEESIRTSHAVLQAEMPCAEVRVLRSPALLSAVKLDVPTVLILDDMAMNLVDVEGIRQRNRRAVVVLLSAHQLVHCSPPSIASREFPYTAKADLVFAVDRAECAPSRIVTSVVRAAEDHLNISEPSHARRFIFLIVDDEPRWFSQFLPVLYGIIGQRAAVKLVRTYETAVEFLFGVERESGMTDTCRDRGYGDDVVCLITDIYFPKGEKMDGDAGRDLIRLVKQHYARIPIIIASKVKDAAALKDEGFVLPKGDPGSLELLRRCIRDRTGIGDCVVYDEGGEERYRLKDVRDMYRLLRTTDGSGAEAERLRALLAKYAEQDRFSTWFHMHGLRELGEAARPQQVLDGERAIARLRRLLKREILRMQRTPLILAGMRVFSLEELLTALRTIPPEEIQPLMDNDAISSWLDQRGCSELAEELRPIHGRGAELGKLLAEAVEKWIGIYINRGESV
jgi:hypothetical protein